MSYPFHELALAVQGDAATVGTALGVLVVAGGAIAAGVPYEEAPARAKGTTRAHVQQIVASATESGGLA